MPPTRVIRASSKGILVATELTGNPPASILVKDCSQDAFVYLPPYVPILLNMKNCVCLMMSGHRGMWGCKAHSVTARTLCREAQL